MDSLGPKLSHLCSAVQADYLAAHWRDADDDLFHQPLTRGLAEHTLAILNAFRDDDRVGKNASDHHEHEAVYTSSEAQS